MNRFFVILVASLGFSQINWEIETVDTVNNPPNEFQYQNALDLDTNEIPLIVFNKRSYSELISAKRIGTDIWLCEMIDSGSFYACPSLVFDKNNTPHCSYYQMVGQTAYLCHSYRDTLSWHKTIIDTIHGILTPYWFSWKFLVTSIDIDTFNNPGIAFMSINPVDSVFYVKYTHFNGINWNTSIVEYDTGCSEINQPSDQSPSLKCDSKNSPCIAFHHIVGSNDTIKLAHWDDSLNKWVIEPVLNNPYGCAAVALAINDQDDPYIVHGVDIGLYCSWRTMGTWYHEYTGIDVGWSSVSLSMDIGHNSKPHILYADPFQSVSHTYKDTIWHYCNDIDSFGLWCLNIALDRTDNPNASFKFLTSLGISGVKYAKGTFVRIEENDAVYSMQNTGFNIIAYPSISYGILSIEYILENKGEAEMNIYDVSGTKMKSIEVENYPPGNRKITINIGNLSCGVYFLVLEQNNKQISKKFLLLN